MYRIGKEEMAAVQRVLESKDLFKVNNAGHEVEHCEAEFREKFGVEHTILMTSGKAALVAALVALGVGPGDEVIVPAYTYIATAIAVVAAGAIPVLAEVDDTLTLDVQDVEKKISPRTKAIVPVHIQGFPCDMDGICALAKEHSLFVVEDACQADGGSYKGRRLGTIGDAGALSFNQFKIISAGEGGMLLTNQKQVFARSLIYHDSSAIAYFGDQLSEIDEPQFCGSEFRSNEVSAAILREQLKKLDGILFDLRARRDALVRALEDIYTIAPSHDMAGDCGTTLALRFESEEEARAFAGSEGVHGYLPIDTGKHVYTHWTPILEKRGAFHPLMDPFKMEANRGLNMNYAPDACPKTLDYLSRTVYVNINPDWAQERVDALVQACRQAAGK